MPEIVDPDVGELIETIGGVVSAGVTPTYTRVCEGKLFAAVETAAVPTREETVPTSER